MKLADLKTTLDTYRYQYDIHYYFDRSFDTGWKISLQGKSIEDAKLLLDSLYDYLCENNISFKVGTLKRFELQSHEDWQEREQGRKALTIYCPDDIRVDKLCEAVYERIKSYQGWYDIKTPTSYAHYAGAVFYRNDRDSSGNYIKAN